MPKKGFALFLLLILLCACAQAAPQLTDAAAVQTDGGWTVTFYATEGGKIAMRLLDAESGEEVYDLGAVQVEAGNGSIRWDGLLPDGTAAASGEYLLEGCLRNYWGEDSETFSLPVLLTAENAQTEEPERLDLTGTEEIPEALDLSSLDAQEAQTWEEIPEAGTEETEEAVQTESAVPQVDNFWDMDPDAYDLSNPEHQQAIWDLMMKPIAVLNVDQKEHVYPTNQPGIDIKPYKTNTAGELHGQSQGVHVLEEDTDGDGYVLIEAYSNDGTVTKDDYMKSIDAKLIRGYVKKSLLMEVKPSDKYALLVDKLRQKMYIFEDGKIIGTLDVSTGLNNKNQPYNESPAGEFITVSKVGLFVSGTMRAEYAIRINGGTLLHEVPYRYGSDGKTKIYSEFEGQLGQKASHGCIRIQRRKNAQGQNMQWLWDHLENKTKVFIWDDQGRTLKPELPDSSLQLYRNPDGGSNYHTDANCSGVKSKFLPLTGDLTYGDLGKEEFSKLTPCQYCGAPARPETLYERFKAEAEQIGYTVTDEDKAAFGVK